MPKKTITPKGASVAVRVSPECKAILEKNAKAQGVGLSNLIRKYLEILSSSNKETIEKVLGVAKEQEKTIDELNETVTQQRRYVTNAEQLILDSQKKVQDLRKEFQRLEGMRVAYTLGVAQKKQIANGDGPEMDVAFTLEGEPVIKPKK